jgi:hypothetical protein
MIIVLREPSPSPKMLSGHARARTSRREKGHLVSAGKAPDKKPSRAACICRDKREKGARITSTQNRAKNVFFFFFLSAHTTEANTTCAVNNRIFDKMIITAHEKRTSIHKERFGKIGERK